MVTELKDPGDTHKVETWRLTFECKRHYNRDFDWLKQHSLLLKWVWPNLTCADRLRPIDWLALIWGRKNRGQEQQAADDCYRQPFLPANCSNAEWCGSGNNGPHSRAAILVTISRTFCVRTVSSNIPYTWNVWVAGKTWWFSLTCASAL